MNRIRQFFLLAVAALMLGGCGGGGGGGGNPADLAADLSLLNGSQTGSYLLDAPGQVPARFDAVLQSIPLIPPPGAAKPSPAGTPSRKVVNGTACPRIDVVGVDPQNPPAVLPDPLEFVLDFVELDGTSPCVDSPALSMAGRITLTFSTMSGLDVTFFDQTAYAPGAAYTVRVAFQNFTLIASDTSWVRENGEVVYQITDTGVVDPATGAVTTHGSMYLSASAATRFNATSWDATTGETRSAFIGPADLLVGPDTGGLMVLSGTWRQGRSDLGYADGTAFGIVRDPALCPSGQRTGGSATLTADEQTIQIWFDLDYAGMPSLCGLGRVRWPDGTESAEPVG